MFVCACNKITFIAIELVIQESTIHTTVSAYSPDFTTPEDQIYNNCKNKLKVGEGCENCEIFIRQFIRDRIDKL